MTIIGIDPGVDGAVAVLNEKSKILTVWDIPSVKISRGKKVGKERFRNDLDVGAIVSFLELYIPDPEMGMRTHIFLERVQPMPQSGMGVVGAFTFGKVNGLIEGVVQALRIPFEYVSPVKWIRTMMPGTDRDKNQSILTVKRLLPTASDWITLRKHHNRAEALLIALYGLRKIKGEF